MVTVDESDGLTSSDDSSNDSSLISKTTSRTQVDTNSVVSL